MQRSSKVSRHSPIPICSKRKLPECFEVYSKQLNISKTLNIAKLSTFIEEDGTIRVKGQLKHSNLDYNAKHPILLTAKHPVVQLLLEKAHRDNLHEGRVREKHAATRILNHRAEKSIKKNQVEMHQMQTQERQPNPPTDGGSTSIIISGSRSKLHVL